MSRKPWRMMMSSVLLLVGSALVWSCGSGFKSGSSDPGTGTAGEPNDSGGGANQPGQGGSGASGDGGDTGVAGTNGETPLGGQPASAGAPGGAGEPGSAGGDGTAGAGGGSDPGEVTCDPDAAPEANAVFASPSGNEANAGTAQLPVQKLSTAIKKAKANFAKYIYLSVGEYSEAETLLLGAAEAGIVIEGGWSKSGAKWTPVCEADRRQLTTIAVASAVALRISDLGGATALRHLTLATKAQGETKSGMPGESLFGIWVSGASSALNLLDVEVIAGAAGAGGSMPKAANGAGAVACSGHGTCCVSGAGCGDNTTGPVPPPTAMPGAPAMMTGTFTSNGYVPRNGANGPTGVPGKDGKEGAAGQNKGNVCRSGGSCGSCKTGGNPSCPGTCEGKVAPNGYTPLAGEAGRCGCGGLGGTGGAGGRGGGASVAVLLTGGATAVAKASVLKAGNGGSGAIGGLGGEGAPGTPGVKGGDGFCVVGCYDGCDGSCGCDQPDSAAGGAAGTRGGQGGAGGPGGAGAGGPAYAVVSVASAFDDAGGNSFQFGEPGAGTSGAAAGQTGELLSVE